MKRQVVDTSALRLEWDPKLDGGTYRLTRKPVAGKPEKRMKLNSLQLIDLYRVLAEMLYVEEK